MGAAMRCGRGVRGVRGMRGMRLRGGCCGEAGGCGGRCGRARGLRLEVWKGQRVRPEVGRTGGDCVETAVLACGLVSENALIWEQIFYHEKKVLVFLVLFWSDGCVGGGATSCCSYE